MAWHGSVDGSGTKDYLLPLSSKSPAHIPTFLQFHMVFWPHHVTEWYLTPSVLALREKDSNEVSWAPQVSAWSNKPQGLKGHLHKISVLRFVLSISKSIMLPHPWQFSISKTVTVNKNYLWSFQLCKKKLFLKGLMHWPSPTRTAVNGRAPIDTRRSRIRVVGNCFDNHMEKKSLNHIYFPFSPSLHTSTPNSWSP